MTFARFMGLALYHPEVGYYRRNRPRVGTGPGTDFVTATATGPVFGELITAACVSLLAGRDPEGDSPSSNSAPSRTGRRILAGRQPSLRRRATVRVGEPAEL